MSLNFIGEDKVCNLLINEIRNNHIAHAYMIDENNNPSSFDIVLSFVKEILCCGLSDIERENLCRRIDDGNYSEIKIIEPDGMLIKKQQILDLQKMFSMAPVEGNKRIYVIRDCEKMRPETANSMLKFLEEPEGDIIAILMTNNINNVLSTIISRCQVIKLGNNVLKSDISGFDELALNFISKIENYGKKSVIDVNDFLFSKISSKDREQLVNFFDKVIDMYYNIMKIIISNKSDMLYYDKLVKFSYSNDKNKILDKINLIMGAKDAIRYNVNCNLLIDSLILSIGG